jgi:hypothetical protein
MLKMLKRLRNSPALVLLLMAPVFGELLSLHQTPLEFFNPFNFVLTALPYGFGAVLCRELVVRWKKGWVSLALLAAAYGIYEEFIVARSVWNPEWAELGALQEYTFRGGFAWTYAEVLLHFHVTISILGGVLLTELLFAERRHQSWVGSRGLMACGVGLALWAVAFFALQPYLPSLAGVVVSVAAMAALIYAAYRLRFPLLAPRPRGGLKPVWIGIVAAFNMSAVFLLAFIIPEMELDWWPPWPVTFVAIALLDAGALWLLATISGNGADWDDRHTLALVTGFLAFFLALAFLQDLAGGAFTGASLVAIVTIWGIYRLGRRLAQQ